MDPQRPGDPSLNAIQNEPPKRFVRTFQTDASTLQQGGTPDFTALPNQAPAEQSEPSAKIPLGRDEIDLTDVAPPVFAPPEAKPISSIPPLSRPAERIVEASSLPPVFIPTPVQNVLRPDTVKPTTPTPIHTYTSDFESRVTDTNASTASILAAEGDTGGREEVSSTKSSVIYVALGIILLILGGGGIYMGYQYLQKAAPVAIIPSISAPIFVNERDKITGTGRDLLEAIEQSVQKPLAQNGVRLLYTDTATSTGSDIFHAIQIGAPGILLRNIDAQNSMTGVVNVNGTQSPFFLLSVSSYTDTFAGMLGWEPRMSIDLSLLYPVPAPASPTASSTQPAAQSFRDAVVANHDVRILRDAANESVILYGYWNPHTLIIAHNESAFSEIINRLATSKTQQ